MPDSRRHDVVKAARQVRRHSEPTECWLAALPLLSDMTGMGISRIGELLLGAPYACSADKPVQAFPLTHIWGLPGAGGLPRRRHVAKAPPRMPCTNTTSTSGAPARHVQS